MIKVLNDSLLELDFFVNFATEYIALLTKGNVLV